jgi:hypothetical protein
MIRAAVVGASGYAGAELVRILPGIPMCPCPSLRPGNTPAFPTIRSTRLLAELSG